MNELSLLILFIFALGNLWHFYPEYWSHSKDIKENHIKNSKEILNRKTKTRTKSKILPTGDLVEQTVITEVTETFSSPNCASDVVVNELLVDHETFKDNNKNVETTLETRKKYSKGSVYNKKEKLKGNLMPFQTLGKKQKHILIIEIMNNLLQGQDFHAVSVILLFIILTNGNFIWLESTPALPFIVGLVKAHVCTQENQSQVKIMTQMFTVFHLPIVLTKSPSYTESLLNL